MSISTNGAECFGVCVVYCALAYLTLLEICWSLQTAPNVFWGLSCTLCASICDFAEISMLVSTNGAECVLGFEWCIARARIGLSRTMSISTNGAECISRTQGPATASSAVDVAAEAEPPLGESTARFWCPELTQEGQWHHLTLILNRATFKNSTVSRRFFEWSTMRP